MTAWGWADTGKKAHWFPDATGRAKCGKGVLTEAAEGIPDKDKCAACRKAADVSAAVEVRAAADAAPTPVRNLLVRVPPGGDACPSGIHAGVLVRATVPGVWVGPAGTTTPDRGTEVNYCGWCAYLLANAFWFIPEAEALARCIRCVTAYADPAHTPCCSSELPHGRPLCCHCYGVTHHVSGVPCH